MEYVVILLSLKMLFKEGILCSPRLHLFDEKYNQNSNIVKYYYNYIFVFYLKIFKNVMQSWI